MANAVPRNEQVGNRGNQQVANRANVGNTAAAGNRSAMAANPNVSRPNTGAHWKHESGQPTASESRQRIPAAYESWRRPRI